jgi:hypothetical protein
METNDPLNQLKDYVLQILNLSPDMNLHFAKLKPNLKSTLDFTNGTQEVEHPSMNDLKLYKR